MSGWVPMPAEVWPFAWPHLPKPWAAEAVRFDLRWQHDQGGIMSRRQLAERYGWTPDQVRTELRHPERWWDPKKGPAPTSRKGADPARPSLTQPDPAVPRSERGNVNDAPVLTQRDPARPNLTQERHTRGDPQAHTPPQEEQPAPGVPVPDWARKVDRPKGVTPAEVFEAVLAILTAVRRSSPPNPKRCGTEAKPVVALWKALEWPPLDEFVADACLVADAAHDCPERLFAHDIRAVDWPEGTDRREDASTVFVQARWGIRLSTARRWAERRQPPRPRPRDAPPIDRPKTDPATLEALLRRKTTDDHAA